jgi:hypothetical protein
MRMQARICTEADYLRAHLTVIEGESHGKAPALHDLKRRVTSILKRWIPIQSDRASTFAHLRKLR